LTLALGIGVNSAIFSVINVVMLSPLPYDDPHELVMLWTTNRETGQQDGYVSYPDLEDLRRLNTTFEDLSAFWTFPNGNVNLTGGSEPERVPVARALAGYFELLGIAPLIGRTFLPEENVVGNHRRALLSFGLWRRRFGGDSTIVGNAVFVNGFPYTVVGIMPGDFRPLSAVAAGNDIQLWRPLAPDDNQTGGRGSRVLRVVGRLRDGVTIAQARADVDRIAAQLADAYPTTNRDIGIRVVALADQVARPVRPALWTLMAAAGLVLLVACVNVAGLMLVRGSAASKQLAIQSALGASRQWMFVRVMTESLMLGVIGVVCGTGLAVLGVEVLVALGPAQIPLLDDVSVDIRVLSFGITAGVVAGLCFGFVPALRASSPDLLHQLRDSGRASGTRRDRRLADAFVTVEIALALILMVASGLLIKSFRQLHDVDPGMDASNVLTLQLELPMSTDYPEQSERELFFAELLDRLRATPGVEMASMGSGPPVQEQAAARRPYGTTSSMTFVVPQETGDIEHDADFRLIGPDYFRTLRIPLLNGRGFEAADRDGPQRIVVSRGIAQQVWGDDEVVGRSINLPFGGEAEIVGVVGEVRAEGLDGRSVPTVYLMSDQQTYNFMTVMVRTRGDPASLTPNVTRTVRDMDARLPVYNVRTMEDIVSASVEEQRFQTLLLTVFSGLTLVLALVGTYTVVSYNVSERTLELSIRSALGAQPRDTMRLILSRALSVALVGVAIGIAGALGASRLLAPFLFEVTSWDLSTFIATPILLLTAAMIATIIPGRRAVHIDPMITMRAER
jgi:predicted permease